MSSPHGPPDDPNPFLRAQYIRAAAHLLSRSMSLTVGLLYVGTQLVALDRAARAQLSEHMVNALSPAELGAAAVRAIVRELGATMPAGFIFAAVAGPDATGLQAEAVALALDLYRDRMKADGAESIDAALRKAVGA